MALTAIHVLEGMLWLSVVALVVNRARVVLTRPSVRRRFEQITGVVLVGFGIRLATERVP
jgi:threonine/homoserine/homoserine lactone efflux protein